MKRKTAFILLIILAAGILCGMGTAEEEAELPVPHLSDETLMTYYSNTIFAGDSLVASFRNYVKTKKKDNPDYFSGIDFRAVNSYLFRYATSRYIREIHGAHLYDGGLDATLYTIVMNAQPEKLFVLAGLNDTFTTDYTMAMQEVDETGYDRAARYVREMTGLVREASPDTQIYIVSQMPVTEEFVQGLHKVTEVQERFDLVNETVRQECESLEIRYVDLATGLKGKDGLMPQDYSSDHLVHLNEAGFEIFARELLDFAQEEYEAGNLIPAAAGSGEDNRG